MNIDVRYLLTISCTALLCGCGYLDTDLFVDDDEFGESIALSGLELSGSGYGFSGCGGFGLHGYGTSGGSSYSSHRYSVRGPTVVARLTDEQILLNTDVDVIDVTPPGNTASTVEKLYFEQLEVRDAALAEHY